MRPEDDLDRYAAARGPVLHEVLLRLDCPPFLVSGVVQEALGRCRRGWARTVRDDDVDVVVLETLLMTWEDRRRATGWEDRAGAVLAEVTGLDEWQVAEVLDGLVRRRRRRPAAKVLAGLLVVVLVVAGLAAWWPSDEPAGPGDADALPDAAVQVAPAVVDTVWYAGGLLRLPDVTVTVGSVRALAAAAGGAVYVAGTGEVVRVDDEGRRTRLGTADPSSPVLASSDSRLVAWREESGDLVVRELATGDELGRVSGTGLEPVALDDDRLYLNDAGGSRAYTPGGEAVRISGLPLLDVRAGARLFRVGATGVRLEAVGGRPSTVGTGIGGRLSPDGRFALVDRGGGEPVVYDLLGGTAATGTAPGERTVAATLVRDGRAVLVVAVPERAADDEEFSRRSASGSWELRTCALGEGACTVASVLSAAGDVPLFAR